MDIKVCEAGNQQWLVTIYEGQAVAYSFYATAAGLRDLSRLFGACEHRALPLL
jgi:hypothetical protein